MYEGYNRIFWGIFISTFHINLGPVQIFPAFVGFLMIVSGLNLLYEESALERFKGVKSWGILTASLSFIGGLVYFFTQSDTRFLFLNIIWTIGFAITQFTLFFKVIEVSIEYLEIGIYEDLKEKYILKLRKYTVFMILNIIFISLSLIFHLQTFFTMGAIIAVILNIYVMTMIYEFREIFEEELIEEDAGE